MTLREVKKKIEEVTGRREGVKELWVVGGNEKYVVVKLILENWVVKERIKEADWERRSGPKLR